MNCISCLYGHKFEGDGDLEKKTIKKFYIISFILLLIQLLYIPNVSLALAPASTPTYLGMDVSAWQGYINYEQARDSGIEYVYIKATEGTWYKDTYLQYNYENAKKEGIKVGVYHFVRATDVASAKAEARYFANAISGLEIDCKLAMDFEEFGNLSNQEINTISFAFLEETERITGKDMVIYSNTNDAINVFNQEIANKYPLWVANYGVQEPYDNGKWSNWVGFQYTSMGRINGVNGYVDLNRFTREILLTQKEPTPIPEPVSPIEPEETTYTVRKGDTLSKIALDYNTTVNSIVTLNNIQNPNLIYIGQKLLIQVGKQSNSREMIYTVKRGDTLSQIALDYDTTVNSIVTLNNIQNPNLIFTGQKIKIRISDDSLHDCGHIIYRIKWGDTLSSIAQKYGVSVQSIATSNNIQNQNLIYAGNLLRICRYP